MRMGLLGAALVLAPIAAGLPPAEAGAQETPPHFRAGAEVVVLDVVVRDRKGRTVRDLREEEIEVYEDGRRQQVVSFRLRAAGQEPAVGEAPRHVNLVTLVFDQLGPDGRRLARGAGLALAGLTDRTDLLVSVFQVRETLRLVQQFTDDRELVRSAVRQATGEVSTQYTDATEMLEEASRREAEARRRLESLGQVTGVGQAAVVAQLGREVDVERMAMDALRLTQALQREQQGQSSLYSLLALAKRQQRLAGRKTILFFSEGIQVPPPLEHVLRTTISEANRANVSIYAVDARGLGDSRRLESARETLLQAAAAAQRQMMTRGAGPVTREEFLALETAEGALRMDVQGALGELASGTGGALIANTNDVRRGIERAVGDLRGYYELVYAPTDREYDGRFRRLEVKVSRPAVAVQARSGYYALPPTEGAATFAFEVDLLKALRAVPAPEDFPLQAALFRFGPEGPGIRYTLVLEIPLAGIRFDPDGGGEVDRVHFSVLAVLRDVTGAVVEKFSEDSPVFLPRSRRDALRQGNAVFLRSFSLPPGRYTLEAAVVDRLARRFSVRRSGLSVRRPGSGLAVSELALVKRTEAVAAGALPSEDPFRMGETRIVPYLPEPHVRPQEALPLFLVAYPSRDGPRADLLVECLRDGRLLGQSLSELPAPNAAGRVPFLARIPVEDLRPGRYEVRVLLKQGGLIALEKTSFVLDGGDN